MRDSHLPGDVAPSELQLTLAILDYGLGNVRSLRAALEAAGAQVRVETDAASALAADALVLPGAGGFGTITSRFAVSFDALRSAISNGMPCLGVGVGMQILFETSEEAAPGAIGALPGRVTRLQARRVPHIGWNEVVAEPSRADARDLLPADTPFYGCYANSFVVEADVADVVGWTEYDGQRFPAIVNRDAVWGTQFRPEKSGRPGTRLVQRLVERLSS